ncbi:pantoate--beta-alanine ligase [Dokdonella sp.]|uniref:pantoate--beta-alanine ligase n=1 Tax=Dokdonella sp. TaxID=2291710 RepID=UPI003529AA72
MQVIREIDQLRDLIGNERRLGKRIGFVPTMGNLHEGHYSLLSIAREHAELTVASIFVNPTQFGVGEDFSRYPRTPEEDRAGLSGKGCDVLYLPEQEAIYPFGLERAVKICVPELGDMLEGAKRPGHFDGVATVVARLFNLVQPDLAVFGNKDYQQLLVVRRMTRDLGFPVRIIGAPIIREANGLAMSSRNQYLDGQQRETAGVIHSTLQRMCERAVAGIETLAQIEADASASLSSAGLSPDYALFRRAEDLGAPSDRRGEDLVALIAARLGPVRLLDNQVLRR